MDVVIEDLTLRYGTQVAVRELSLAVADGESLVLLGQSGCGKTSTMRCVAGLEEPNGGSITVGSRVVFDSSGTNVPPHKRNIGMVFQSYAVWPHRTVYENVAFPLQMKKQKKEETRRRVAEVLDLVGLASLGSRNASKLSGGQMQRVALARSLAMQPSVLLLDEPLSNLDARLRDRLRIELRDLQQRLGVTSIYVTHDQAEAIALADRIAVMQGGRIVQVASPEEVYTRPASASIADFLGVSNLFDCERVDGSGVLLTGTDISLVADHVPAGDSLKACIRPDHVRLEPPDVDGDGDGLHGSIEMTMYQGTTMRYRVAVGDVVTLDVVIPVSATAVFERGDKVRVRMDPDAVQVLPAEVPAG